MSNYELSPASIVSQLRALLSDRYPLDDGHVSILKEIVQNADDARASRLDLVLLEEGVPGAKNPLLHGAALACINNGPFTGRDDEAMRALSMTSKAEDPATVGRFGLGQKSVFHLSEAYFYLGWSAEDGGAVRANVLDPWAGNKGDVGHPLWDDFSDSDKDGVLQRLVQWTGARGASQNGFVLYLPLRREEHRRPLSRGVITVYFPKMPILVRDLRHSVELGCLLPQLHHVREINAWHVAGDVPTHLASASSPRGASRLSRPSSDAALRGDFYGKIEIRGARELQATVHYFGREQTVPDPRFSELIRSELWPKRATSTPENDVAQVPEQAVPHGAVTVLCFDRGDDVGSERSGSLHADWAVFLPLGGDLGNQQKSRSSRWRIWLHGYFFPDAGRRQVLGMMEPSSSAVPEKEHEVRVRWNALVRDVATLPCLLPAVRAAVAASPPKLGEELGHALAASELWNEVRIAATVESVLAWGPTLNKETPAVESEVREVSSTCWLVPVPRPTSDQQGSAGVMAVVLALRGVAQSRTAALVWSDGPRLGRTETWHSWPDAWVSSALAAIEPKSLAEEHGLTYLLRCLRLVESTRPSIGLSALDLLRRCLLEKKVSLGGKNVALWRELALLCPRHHLIWSDANLPLLRMLASRGASVAVLPSDLAPAAVVETLPPLQIEQARALLVALGEVLVATPSDPEAGKIAEELVSRVGPDAVLAEDDLAARPLLRVWSARERTHVCRSLSAIQTLSIQGAVLRRKGLLGPETTARRLFEALDDGQLDVVLVGEGALADALSAETFSDRLLARLMGSQSCRIAAADKRRALFRTLVGKENGAYAMFNPEAVPRDSDLYFALRLVLHGEVVRRRDKLDLLVPMPGSEGVLRRLEQKVLKAVSADWRFVPEEMASDLDGRWMTALGVIHLTPKDIIQTLEGRAGTWRQELGAQLDVDERARLRKLLAAEGAVELFRDLAIHDTPSGVISGSAVGVYLASSWPLPGTLTAFVTLVQLAPDRSVAEIQQRALTPWSAVEQVKLCLAQPDPAIFAGEILDALPGLGTQLIALCAALRQATWVATTSAQSPFVRPDAIMNLPYDLDSAVRAVVTNSERVYFTPGSLSTVVRDHAAFSILCESLALTGSEAVHAAALQLGDALPKASNPLWILPEAPTGSHRQFLERGSSLRALNADRGWSFIRALLRGYPDLWFGEGRDLLDLLHRTPTAARIVELLNALATEADLTQESDHRFIFAEYLGYAGRRHDFSASILPHLHFRDATGAWRPAGALTRRGENLEPRYRLHAEHARLLPSEDESQMSPAGANGPATSRLPPTAADEANAARVLAEYVSVLRGHVSLEALGHFVAMLGDGRAQKISALAEGMLQSRDVENARLTLCELMSGGYTGQPGDLRDSRWAVEVLEGGAEVRGLLSLTGQEMTARVATATSADLFVGRPPWARGQHVAKWLLLRRIDPDAHVAAGLSEVLKNTVRAFFVSAIKSPLSEKFDLFWKGMAPGGLSLVEPARRWMRARMPVYVDSLVGRRDDRLRDVLHRIERADHRLAEIDPSSEHRLISEEKNRKGAQQELERLVEQDAEVQKRLVDAVRRKVASNGYVAAQVIFELFQNSDDAATQLAEIRGKGRRLDDAVRKFMVEVVAVDDPPVLRVRHWGRAINQQIEPGSSFSGGAEKGYDLDLHRMLVLHQSDKDEDMTGRFGLGFKSVYLLTSAPRIQSGSLSLEIVAGFFPRHWAVDGVTVDDSTTLELPLRDRALLASAMVPFRANGGLLTVFAQTIRRVEIDADERADVCWRPRSIDGVPDLEIGELQVDLRADAPVFRLLVVRVSGTGPRLALAFKLGAKGIEAFGESVPTIWCTVPTTGLWRIGFCANGPFVLDVGRSQLSHGDSRNLAIFRQLGGALEAVLRALHSALLERFEATSESLGLELGARTPDEVRSGFWRTVFERLVAPLSHEPENPAHAFARALNEGDRGLSGLLRDLAVLPTNLPRPHDGLIRLADVRWILDDLVASPEVLLCISQLAWCDRELTIGSCIQTSIADRLDRLGAAPVPRPTALALADIFRRALPVDTKITPALASTVWRIRGSVTKALVADWTRDQTLGELQVCAGSWLFRTRNEKHRAPSTLLLGEAFLPLVQGLEANRREQLKDEILRAAFAPEDAVLRDDYACDVETLELFLFARRGLVADVVKLAEWARAASTPGARVAVVRYLAYGLLGEGLRDAFARSPAWCDRATFERLAGEARLESTQRSMIEVVLFRARTTYEPEAGERSGDDSEEEGPDPIDEGVSPSHPPVSDPFEVLKKIAEWWKKVGKDRISAYEREVYPQSARVAVLGAALASRQRAAWLLLFTLGACQRLGRQTSDQHRGFVELLQANGLPRWWSTIIKPRATTTPKDWMQILDQWMGDADQPDDDRYRRWFGLFPTLYQLHRHGDVYMDLLLQAPARPPENFDLDVLFAPKSDSALRGTAGAFDVPRLTRALGIGAPWVLRELVRLNAMGVGNLEHLWPYCFVPRRPTRQLLVRLGAADLADSALTGATASGLSRRIHDFLVDDLDLDEEDATFGGAFDLPLYIIATDAGAQVESGVAEDLS